MSRRGEHPLVDLVALVTALILGTATGLWLSRGPAVRRSADCSEWLRLERKIAGAAELELDLVVGAAGGPGLWIGQLLDLLQAGDRVRITIALESPAAAADDPLPEVHRWRKSG
jgi:hypothetical protein